LIPICPPPEALSPMLVPISNIEEPDVYVCVLEELKSMVVNLEPDVPQVSDLLLPSIVIFADCMPPISHPVPLKVVAFPFDPSEPTGM